MQLEGEACEEASSSSLNKRIKNKNIICIDTDGCSITNNSKKCVLCGTSMMESMMTQHLRSMHKNMYKCTNSACICQHDDIISLRESILSTSSLRPLYLERLGVRDDLGVECCYTIREISASNEDGVVGMQGRLTVLLGSHKKPLCLLLDLYSPTVHESLYTLIHLKYMYTLDRVFSRLLLKSQVQIEMKLLCLEMGETVTFLDTLPKCSICDEITFHIIGTCCHHVCAVCCLKLETLRCPECRTSGIEIQYDYSNTNSQIGVPWIRVMKPISFTSAYVEYLNLKSKHRLAPPPPTRTDLGLNENDDDENDDDDNDVVID